MFKATLSAFFIFGLFNAAVQPAVAQSESPEGDAAIQEKDLLPEHLERFNYITALIHDTDYAQATREILDAWSKSSGSDSPEARDMRLRLCHCIKHLCTSHPPARRVFRRFEAEERRNLEVDPSPTRLARFIGISFALDMRTETMAWWDNHCDDEKYKELLRTTMWRFEWVFRENERWVEFGEIYRRDRSRAISKVEMLAKDLVKLYMFADGTEFAPVRPDHEENYYRVLESIAQIHTGLIAADHDALAIEVVIAASDLVENDTHLKAEVIKFALTAGYPHECHHEWATEIGIDELAERVERALDQPDDSNTP